MAKKMTETEAQLASHCRAELSRSMGYHGDEWASYREQALRYFNGDPRGDEVAGRSTVISMDLADMIGAVTAQLVPMLSSDCVVEFEPQSAEDEDAAASESRAVNKVIMDDNRGFIELEAGVIDALLLRNACFLVDVETDEETATRTFEGADPALVGAYLQSAPPNEQRTLTAWDGDTGSGTVRIVRTNRRYRFEAVDITRMRFRANYDDMDLQDIPFVAEQRFLTKSELLGLGIPRAHVEDLPVAGMDVQGDTRARDISAQPSYEAESWDQDTVECHWCYILRDMNKDGKSERVRVLLAGENTVLKHEPVEWVPYALGTCLLRPHELAGYGLFDKLKQVQDGKTAIQRQMLDNLDMNNNNRSIANEDLVELSDLLDSKPGGVVRATNVDAVKPFPILDTGNSSLSALNYFDTKRTEAGGASLDMLSSQAAMLATGSQGVERQYSAKEQLVQLMATNFAETVIRPVWLLMHRTLRAYALEPVTMKVAGRYVESNPSEWPARTALNVKAGMTAGQRSAAGQALLMGMNLAERAMSQGLAGVLATPETLHAMFVDWMRLQGLEGVDRYVIDPRSEAAQQAAQQSAQRQQEQAQKIDQLAVLQAQIEKGKLDVEMAKATLEASIKAMEMRGKAEIEEAKLMEQATRGLDEYQRDTETAGAAYAARSDAYVAEAAG